MRTREEIECELDNTKDKLQAEQWELEDIEDRVEELEDEVERLEAELESLDRSEGKVG